ncbi:MAG: transcriptional regulator NrdR [Nitrospiraceae bacterium]|mgnify:CR=1 FL=1|nr:transcriptional regulator NrdR [Nitrospiraceae bacterium]
MKCPFCHHLDDRVVDSRLAKEGEVIRRRRECLNCKRRVTTYERFDDVLPMVIKKDGRREAYDRRKVISGLRKACEKRSISHATIEGVADRIEKKLQEQGESEIPSQPIGELVMIELHHLDPVAYVRFASVYREFKDIQEFSETIRKLSVD